MEHKKELYLTWITPSFLKRKISFLVLRLLELLFTLFGYAPWCCTFYTTEICETRENVIWQVCQISLWLPGLCHLWPSFKWGKVFMNGQSKICERQNLKWCGLLMPQVHCFTKKAEPFQQNTSLGYVEKYEVHKEYTQIRICIILPSNPWKDSFIW